MIKEIYIRSYDDPWFQEHVIEFKNEAESILTQLRVLFDTDYGDVLGAPNFGTDIRYLVFSTVIDSLNVKKRLMEKIRDYVYISPNVKIDIEVNFGKDDMQADYAVIDVLIDGARMLGYLVSK